MLNERVMVFIDGSNFYHGLKNIIDKKRIDFNNLTNQLVTNDRKLIRVYYYNSPVNQKQFPEMYKEQQKFFISIQSLPYYELKLGRLEPRNGTVVEKGVDVKLALDMVMFCVRDQYDVAILISADGDFADAVQYVKDMGKHVEVAYPTGGKCQTLKNKCDKFIELKINSQYLKTL